MISNISKSTSISFSGVLAYLLDRYFSPSNTSLDGTRLNFWPTDLLPQYNGARQIIWTLSLSLIILSGYSSKITAAEQQHTDFQLKAAFILNFPSFIVWPPSSSNAKTIICSFNADAVAGSIELLLASPRMTERNAKIAFFRDPDIDTHCDLAFIGSKARGREDTINTLKRNLNTLLVSDIPNFAVGGGMLELALVGSNIKVILNRDVMNDRGFIVDSRLLELTKQVSTAVAQEIK